MPYEPISVQSTVVVAKRRGDIFEVPAIIGDGSAGTATANTVYTVTNDKQAGIYFGSGTALHTAAQRMFDQGVPYIKMIAASASTTAAYDNAYSVLSQENIDILALAGHDADPAAGDYSLVTNHVSKCDTYDWLTALHADLSNISTSDVNTLVTAFNSERTMLVVGKNASSELGAAVCGIIARHRPWQKLMWQEVAGVTADKIDETTTNAIETDQGNALIYILDRWILSNGYSTSSTSTLKYFDVGRTKRYITNLIKTSLKFSQITGDIPYTQEGLNIIKSIISREVASLKDTGAITSYTIDMPRYEDISSTDITNRVLNNVTLTVNLAGHVQTLNIDLQLQI